MNGTQYTSGVYIGDSSGNVNDTSGSYVWITNPGTYTMSIICQFLSNSNDKKFFMWATLDGSGIPNSSCQYTTGSGAGKQVCSVSLLIENITKKSKFQFLCYTDDANGALVTTSTVGVPTNTAVSLIVNQVTNNALPAGNEWGNYLYYDTSAWLIGSDNILMGSGAGKTTQGTNAVAIGKNAGNYNQGNGSLAIGLNAGATGQLGNTIVIDASNSGITTGGAGRLYVAPIRASDTSQNILNYNTTTKEITYTSKTFVIDHPLDSEQYLVHACLEGPEAGVYYRGKGVIMHGTLSTIIRLPEYVDTLANEFTVHVTCKGHPSVLGVSDVESGRFEVFTDSFKGVEFFWVVYGKRFDIDVEPYKDSVNVHGSGPYRWIK